MSEQSFKRSRSDSALDLRKHQREFYEEYFRKGVELTQALITENEELRSRLSALEEAAKHSDVGSPTKLDRVERDHHDLACLFVSQTQLARAVEIREATTVMTEVLLNFVGADRFAIYITNGASDPKPLYVYNADRRSLAVPAAIISESASAGTVHIGDIDRREVTEEPVVVFPLQTTSGPFGAIAIWSFLPQKQGFAAIDRRLFDVLSWAGGSALEMVRLRGQPRSTEPPDRFSALSLLLGMS
jgi:hypothetical protein